MPDIRSATPDSNWILRGLPRKNSALPAPDLESVDLPLRRSLEARNRKIEHVYFRITDSRPSWRTALMAAKSKST